MGPNADVHDRGRYYDITCLRGGLEVGGQVGEGVPLRCIVECVHPDPTVSSEERGRRYYSPVIGAEGTAEPICCGQYEGRQQEKVGPWLSRHAYRQTGGTGHAPTQYYIESCLAVIPGYSHQAGQCRNRW